MILDISIKQFEDEIQWLTNVNPEQTEKFEEIFSDELNQLILLASDSLDKFIQKLDKPLDKVNYKMLAKLFLFNEITEYIQSGESSFTDASYSQLYKNTNVSMFNKKIMEIKSELQKQYDNTQSATSKDFESLNKIIQRLDWLLVNNNVGPNERDSSIITKSPNGQKSNGKEGVDKYFVEEEFLNESKFSKEEQTWRAENLSPHDKYMMSEFKKKVDSLWPKPGASAASKTKPIEIRPMAESINKKIALYLFESSGNYNIKFESV